ncbi:FAD-binding domain-containing protein [Pelagicoccus sp. SDUM812002]|uniref:FAD-binding domain-containing protein n=1 Tax=Pelagicoccus sp. SDUM812002 TaxID=3041266 RepID=UPI00280F2E1F|nr:FAD-binding domain-containing protein [Pelagicoccus sp. SDUM812002]MDQ8188397.1 FAD-binding domain-containing protein [Pelagicoccus sp. SDUM812002]
MSDLRYSVVRFKRDLRVTDHRASELVQSRTTARGKSWNQSKQTPLHDSYASMALRSFLSRCHWQCHFMQKLEDEPAIEFHPLHPALENLRPPTPQADFLDAWQHGQTGYPFVDACIRYLNTHRRISFRMQAMLAAFAAYGLWIGWRRFKDPLARASLDYEPGIHYSQIQSQSGTTGINSLRIYNPSRKGSDRKRATKKQSADDQLNPPIK